MQPGKPRAEAITAWNARPLVQQAIAAEGGELVAGTRCRRCGMYAPDKLSGDCNRPECEYRRPSPPTEAQIRAAEREKMESTLGALEGKHGEGWIRISMEERRLFARLLRAAIRSLKESDNGAG